MTNFRGQRSSKTRDPWRGERKQEVVLLRRLGIANYKAYVSTGGDFCQEIN